MRTSLLAILVICCIKNGAYAQQNNPMVSRERRLIYRIVEEVDVQVVKCKFFDRTRPILTYFDVTQHCLKAPNTGIFVDKWEDRNSIYEPGSLVDVQQYTAKADLIRNEIKLRSGTICKYDRGFCYDTKVGNNSAVVWEVKKGHYRSVESCPQKLEQLFFGYVDIWDFPEKHLKYLFYSNQNGDEAFFLKLTKKIICRNIETYVTEENYFLVSGLKLTPRVENTRILNKHYFPLQTSKTVSEAIMKNFELHEYPLDFSKEMSNRYFEDPENLRILFQKLREEIRIGISKAAPNNTKGSSIDPHKYLSGIEALKVRIAEKNTEIRDILNRFSSAETDLGANKNAIEKLNKLINSFSQKYEGEIVNFNETLSAINQNIFTESNRISKLIFEKESITKQEFEKIKSFVNNQVNNLITRSDFEKRLSDMERDLDTKINEFIVELNLSEDRNKQFENSLNVMRLEEGVLKGDFEKLKKQCEAKVETLEKQITGNFNTLKNSFQTVLKEVTENKFKVEADTRIAALRGDLEKFKLSSANELEMKSKNIYETIGDTSRNSATKLELSLVKDQIDSLSRNVDDVPWNILKNLKDDPVPANIFNIKFSELGEVINEKIKQLRADFTNELTEQRKQCDCEKNFDKLTNHQISLENSKNEIFENTKNVVEANGRRIKADLDHAVTDLRGQLEANQLRFAKILTDRLQDQDAKINQLQLSFATEVSKLNLRIDELSDKIAQNIEEPIEQ